MLRNETYSEEIEAYNGLVHQNPATKLLCVCMAAAMFSLVGLPPFGGFFAKLLIFLATFKAGYLHWGMWLLLGVAGVNTVFSLFYYVRVLKAMFISPEPAEKRVLHTPGMAATFVALISIPLLVLGASPLQDGLARTAYRVAEVLFR
jgi:NADH-quinone oxidoreductase subunit N